MTTVETVMNDIKELVNKLGAVDGMKACDIKFKDHPKEYEQAKINIAKALGMDEKPSKSSSQPVLA